VSGRGRNGFTPEIKVGIFIVCVIVALLYLTTRINSDGFSLKKLEEYHVYFSNVSGLLPRTPVEFAGIRVGHVEDISMAQGEVRVRIRVNPDVQIYEDSYVGLQTRGLLGEKIIMIQGGGKGPVIPPGGAIRNTVSATGFEDAMSRFSETADAIRDLIKGGDGKASLGDIISNTTDITEDIRALMKNRSGDLNHIVSNLREVSEAMRGLIRSEDPRSQSALEKLQATMDRFDQASQSLQSVMAKIERGEGTVGKLLSDDSTVEKMNDALDGINEFVGQVKQLEIAVGFRAEYMGSEKEPIAVTSFRFRPSYDKYFLLEFTDGPLSFAKRKRTTTITETTPPGTTIERTITTRRDDFSLTAMFARRFYDFTLKAGVFRSSGYVGAEYHLFRDHLSLAVDAFDFNRDENPQLRMHARLNLFKIFHLSGGVDDLIHQDGRRNFFAGAGFLLTDDDLKKLLGVASFASVGR